MTKIIAEIGSNFDSVEDQTRSIELAKIAGADIVKFQWFNEYDLYGPMATTERRCQPALKTLAKVCENLHIELMCTAFSTAGVAYVDKFVRRHKIASAEMCDVDIIDAVKATGKPILMSTGGHTLGEVCDAVDYLGNAKTRTTLLYCEAAYPTNRTMPERLLALHDETGLDVGISDHSREVYLTGWLAKAVEAPYIEKHVNLVGSEGPDAGHSLDRDEFASFCKYIKNAKAMRTGLIDESEADMVLQHNRRIVTTCEIPKGTAFVKGVNFGFYRGVYEDSHTLSPFDWSKVNGKIATRTLHPMEAIAEGDFK